MIKYIMVIVTAALIGVAVFSCTPKTYNSAWECYCDKYNVNSQHPTKAQEAFFWDCFCESDSAQEFKALR